MDPKQTYRQLLKAEADLIIGTLSDIIQQAQDGFAKLIQPPHVGHASDERVFGIQLKTYYETGIQGRASSIAHALQTELLDTTDNLGQIIDTVSLSESLAENVTTLTYIKDHLSKLVAKL